MTLRKKIGRSKYGNVSTVLDGLRFASKKEGFRWLQLRQLEREGRIKNLKRQVPYPLIVNGVLIAKYIADYVYEKGNQTITEDCKGVKTDVYRIKAKLMQACHDIEVLET